MAAIDELSNAWAAQVAKISDAVFKAEANYLLEQYIAAIPQQKALEADRIISYSIGGRTVTRRDVSAGQKAIQALRFSLNRYCYGSTTLADANSSGNSN